MRSVSRKEGAGGERQAARRGQSLSVEQGKGRIAHLTQSMGGSTVPGIQSVYCLEAVTHSSVEACPATESHVWCRPCGRMQSGRKAYA